MNQPLYKQYENTKPIGVYPMGNWGGLEILDIIDGGDRVVAAWNFGTRSKIKRYRIQYAPSGRSFIRKDNIRFYTDSIMRVR